MSNGVADLQVSSLSAGTHDLTAVYNGAGEEAIQDLSSTSPVFVETVAKGDQTISFSPIADQVYGASPIPLSAISSVNLPVSYSVVSGPAYVSANHLYITGAGAVEVQADQAGNATYNAALRSKRPLPLPPRR